MTVETASQRFEQSEGSEGRIPFERYIRRLPIRARIFLMAATNVSVVIILAILLWTSSRLRNESWKELQGVRGSERLVTAFESEAGRVQSLIHRYFIQPTPEVLAEIESRWSSITGDLFIDMDYNLDYRCAIQVNARHFTAHNVFMWRAALGWLIGDPSWASSGVPGDAERGDSEIEIIGAATPHCLRAVEAVGANTIIKFTGAFLYSFPWTLPEGCLLYTSPSPRAS